jgi:hypothetical protein
MRRRKKKAAPPPPPMTPQIGLESVSSKSSADDKVCVDFNIIGCSIIEESVEISSKN